MVTINGTGSGVDVNVLAKTWISQHLGKFDGRFSDHFLNFGELLDLLGHHCSQYYHLCGAGYIHNLLLYKCLSAVQHLTLVKMQFALAP